MATILDGKAIAASLSETLRAEAQRLRASGVIPRLAIVRVGDRPDDLAKRKVVILTDTDPAADGALRQQLRPREFGLVLIDIDGSIVQRRPVPTSAREIINLIDRTPSRREETGSRRP